MSELIQDHEINLNRLESIFKAAFLRTERDKDGDLIVNEGGTKVFVKVDSDRKIITFFAIWQLKENAPEIEKLRLASRLNDKRILARFSVPNPRLLWCDYCFLYEEGVTPYFVINTYKRFVSIFNAAPELDTADVIG